MYERLLVAFDGSQRSWRALREGIGLAARHKVELFAVTVLDRLPDYVVAEACAPVEVGVVGDMAAARNAELEALTAEAVNLALQDGVHLHAEVVAGRIVDSIVQAVRNHGCDLLIIGLSQHSGLISLLLSHTLFSVAEHAPCSVLAVL